MIGRTKLSHDRVLIDPSANEIAAEIAAATRAADSVAEHGFLRTATLPPPEGPDGHRQQQAELEPEHREIPPEENRNVAVLGLALSRLVAHTRDEHASYNPGSSVHCTSRDLLFLDGGFESRHGNYMPGRRGSWIRGLRAFRFVCYELGLVQPRRLKGEERIPSHEELLHELGHIKPVLHNRHTLV